MRTIFIVHGETQAHLELSHMKELISKHPLIYKALKYCALKLLDRTESLGLRLYQTVAIHWNYTFVYTIAKDVKIYVY